MDSGRPWCWNTRSRKLGRLVGRHFCGDWSKIDQLAEATDEREDAGTAFGSHEMPMMKSMLADRHEPVVMGSEQRGACLDAAGFTRWRISQERTHFRIYLYMGGQQKSRDIAANVFSRTR
ncbi:hypothetical protein PF003_g32334 [Phytophthora fragariae]|nr:hypothetical protein PF003_g32334 [Phytophthora fragariae]